MNIISKKRMTENFLPIIVVFQFFVCDKTVTLLKWVL